MVDSKPPSELAAFAALLDAQPRSVQESFQYCLCLIMLEAGRMRLIDVQPGESRPIYLFESAEGERFVVARPPLSQEQEAELITALREILREEGLLD